MASTVTHDYSMSSKYHIYYDGKTIMTTVTDRVATTVEWVNEILSIHAINPKVVVGLDVKWRQYGSIGYKSNKSATLQLCIDNNCLILQLLHMEEIPQTLKDFLLNPKFTFVGIGIDNDIITTLRNEYGLEWAKSADIKEVAMKKWPWRFSYRQGLEDLARELVGLHIEKPLHGDWQARVLTQKQVEHACVDAYASYKIGCMLKI